MALSNWGFLLNPSNMEYTRACYITERSSSAFMRVPSLVILSHSAGDSTREPLQ
jgi:hypothetical protein